MEYANVPKTIGAILSHDKAKLHELQTIYSIEDVYLMIEVLNVDAHNQKVLSKRSE